jgi:hypothetical protein
MARRVYTMTLRCAASGCRETSFCETESRKEEAEAYARYAKFPYRCYRHAKPDEVLSAENLTTTATVTANETKYGIYWGVTPDKASSGIASGPGFRAIAKDFPPATRLIVTARIEFPDDAAVSALTDSTEGTA